LVSAMMMPRSRAQSAPWRYSSSETVRTLPARASPSSPAAALKEMFSSWPCSAFVDGVNTGSGRRSDSSSPVGSRVPCIVPSARYSFQADPVM
jgi:hypothetical protein